MAANDDSATTTLIKLTQAFFALGVAIYGITLAVRSWDPDGNPGAENLGGFEKFLQELFRQTILNVGGASAFAGITGLLLTCPCLCLCAAALEGAEQALPSVDTRRGLPAAPGRLGVFGNTGVTPSDSEADAGAVEAQNPGSPRFSNAGK